MYGLEEMDGDEYCVHLPDGAILKVCVNESGNLEEEVVRYDANSEREMTYLDLTTDLRSFIRARTGKEFEPAVEE